MPKSLTLTGKPHCWGCDPVTLTPENVSAVVCTMNSISGIESCLQSLEESGVGEIIVVDANSTDGTREIALKRADKVLSDPGLGLGNARNVGIAETTKPLILNMGSDNIMPAGQLQIMIESLTRGGYKGVSARTIIRGNEYLARGLNAWRAGRFPQGEVKVIGTPTLFMGDLLRSHPYDATRRFSDDSELCERWHSEFDAIFAISDAYVEELGKTSWDEVIVRCRMYGISDEEVFRKGKESGWTASRQLKSIVHPARVDLFHPLTRLDVKQAIEAAPFLATFVVLRYASWAETAFKKRKKTDRETK